MKIRDAVQADLPAIVQIYNHSIPGRMATGDLELISVESRQAWFDDHPPDSRPLWVMETEGAIAGWLSFQSFYGRAAYVVTAELSIYISPYYQRQGVGKKLLERAIASSPSLGIRTLVAYIFAHNYPSLQLFSNHCFERWGYLPKVAELDTAERDLVILGRPVV